MTNKQNIWSAVLRYRSDYKALLQWKKKNWRMISEDGELRPLIHLLLEHSGLPGVTVKKQYDIMWNDPRVKLVGEIKNPCSPEFWPPKQEHEGWGYIKKPEPNQRGDGLAQLHRLMKEAGAIYGIFTNCEVFQVWQHQQPFGDHCYLSRDPDSPRCGFPKREPLSCDLVEDGQEEIVPLFEFLLQRWCQ